MSNLYLDQPQVVSNVHNLVMRILTNTISFEDVKSQLKALYYPFMTYLNPDLDYSQPVELFLHTTKIVVGDLEPAAVLWSRYKTQRLINLLLSSNNNQIVTENTLLDYQNAQNRKCLEHYVSSTINHHSRLLFIYIELAYQQDTRHHVTIETFTHHMEVLKGLMADKKTVFKHLQGYAWNIHQGADHKGLHCHLLLMYDGSRRDSDWYLAKNVGEKWTEITAGLGEYDSYNDIECKQLYTKKVGYGLGLIRNDKPKQIEKALRTASLLFHLSFDQPQQQPKLQLPNMYTFGHGLYYVPKRLSYLNSKVI